MSDSLQSTDKDVSNGGSFEVLTDNNDTFKDWRQMNVSTVTDNNLPKKLDGTVFIPNVVPSNFRIWEAVDIKTTSTGGTGFKFKVMSYNVLAQCLLQYHQYLYTECCIDNLKWDTRSSRLYDEIIRYAPDILCLQEVQASHLSSFYSKFEQIGYTGIFKQKTGYSKDGCAIYFKKSLFELKDHVNVEFYQPKLPILNRDNIGILVKLVPRHLPDSPIVIATTHLLYNPNRTDVRLAQMQLFLAEIDRFSYYFDGKEFGRLPIIITGDFNSTPDNVVIKLLDTGHVCTSPFRDGSDWRLIGVTDNCQHLSVYLNQQEGHSNDINEINISNSECCETKDISYIQHSSALNQFSNLFNSNVIGHSLNLISVYDKYKDDDSYEATTFQDYWVTVDYIYFSRCSSLKVLERLRLPTVVECQALGALPNDVYGSDHLALSATFELRPLQ